MSFPVEEIPQYELLAPEFIALKRKGASIQTIAASYGMCWTQAKQVIAFAEKGVRPSWPSKKKRGGESRDNANEQKYRVVSGEVSKRRSKGESIAKIARELGIGKATVRRALDFANQDEVRASAKSGKTPNRGRWRHISSETMERVRALLKLGDLSIREIAAETGVSQSTIRREKLK